MTEPTLTDLLERAAARTTPGPPPIEAMHARVARRRRRRTVALCVTAAVTVAATAGGTALLVDHSPSIAPPPVASPSPGVVPLETRLVGIGHAGIARPKPWGTNQTQCVTPHRDTVIFARDGLLCAIDRPAGVESVEVGHDRPMTMVDFTADETIEIDGVRAQRQRTTCTEEGIGSVRTCSGVVLIPSLNTWFWAESSTNAEEVDRILERIEIVPDQVGVPEPRWGGTPPSLSGQEYADALTELGLKPKIVSTKSPSYSPGDLLGVSPAAGTMLPLGATVTLTVVAR
jgi:hypothetical protein